ncbi:MAG: hypothetical protein MIL41_16865 [Hyphomicrobiales bacterium]|jgi:hypothetical protein
MRGFICFLAFLAYYVVSPTLALHLTGSRMVEIGVALANAVIALGFVVLVWFRGWSWTFTVEVRFVENLERVLKHAWSVRFLGLATVLDAAQTGCSFFSGTELVRPGVLAGLNMALALAALGARLVAQEADSGTAAPADGGQA